MLRKFVPKEHCAAEMRVLSEVDVLALNIAIALSLDSALIDSEASFDGSLQEFFIPFR